MKRHAEPPWRAIVVVRPSGRLVICDRLRRPNTQHGAETRARAFAQIPLTSPQAARAVRVVRLP